VESESPFACDFQKLKMVAKEFFELSPNATHAELENGMKCYGLHAMYCEFPDDFMGNIQRESELPALTRIVHKEYFKRVANHVYGKIS
jgi:hypothetical protein